MSRSSARLAWMTFLPSSSVPLSKGFGVICRYGFKSKKQYLWLSWLPFSQRSVTLMSNKRLPKTIENVVYGHPTGIPFKGTKIVEWLISLESDLQKRCIERNRLELLHECVVQDLAAASGGILSSKLSQREMIEEKERWSAFIVTYVLRDLVARDKKIMLFLTIILVVYICL